MLVQIGRILFALGVVVAVALAAKAPKFEAALRGAEPLAAQLPREADARVLVSTVESADATKTAAAATSLKQALMTLGATVVEPPAEGETAEAPTHVVSGKLSGDEQLEVTLSRAGEATPLATATLDLAQAWPSTLPMWGLFAALAAVGVALWRVGNAQAAKEAAADGADSTDNPFTLLAGMVDPARKLAQDIGTLTDAQILRRVDEILDGYLLPFVVVRQRVLDRLGMKQGSEILVTVAFGERMLNRVWSATADGHLEEARACYPEALAALEEAQRLAKEATESSSGGPSGAPVAVADASGV